jgi:hypothetical protein
MHEDSGTSGAASNSMLALVKMYFVQPNSIATLQSGIVLNPVNGAAYEGMIAPYLDSRKIFLMPTLDFMLLNGDVGETPSQSARIMRRCWRFFGF